MRATLKVKSRGDLNAILRKMMKEGHVNVGILSKDAERKEEGEALNNAQLARVHEYGHARKGIPARPFLRPTIEKNAKTYAALFERIARASRANTALAEKALGLIGAKAQADVRKFITAGPQIPPPNSPAYLKWKKSRGRKGATMDPRTLVLTGQMVRAVTWAVILGSAKEGAE